jgi:hypothetical protein
MADFAVPLDAYDAAQLRRQFDTPKSCNVRCTLGCVRNNSRLDEWRPQPGAPAGPADG